ncbi:adenine phosphoribosyltransferase [Thozetella sp. PMI_491]|nr:adenine phosphoribosyltransferase [Thozetella sp. PMI_491]
MTSTTDSTQAPALASTSLEQPPALTSTAAAILAESTKTSSASPAQSHDDKGRQPTAAAAAAAELSSTKISLLGALKRFPDFPIPGINFIDILPLFQDPAIHTALLRALELQVFEQFGADNKPDVVVGLDARGFLFGPSLALRLDASFVPVRKKGKMPGPCVTASYQKEYGTDFFQMQEGAVKPGQKVLVVDDIIATGGSAEAAGSLVAQLGGELIGYLFILEIPFLKGREKLGGLPTVTLLETDD